MLSMCTVLRQAIEEGFILDVLENYTTYQTYVDNIILPLVHERLTTNG